MCKNCEWYQEDSKEKLLAGLELHKRALGWSGYPGAEVAFNKYLDDKEVISYIIYRAKELNFLDVVELGEKYRKEIVAGIKGYLE
jgi:hypothetical protein